MRVVTGNKWWASLKCTIGDFTNEYDRQFNLEWTRLAKSIKYRLSGRVDPLKVELTNLTLQRIRNKFKVKKSSQRSCEIECRKVFGPVYRDTRRLSDAPPWLLCSLSWSPAAGVLQLFNWLLPPSGGRISLVRGWDYWMRSPWCARTRWSTLRSVRDSAAHVCTYSDVCVQPLVRPGSHRW